MFLNTYSQVQISQSDRATFNILLLWPNYFHLVSILDSGKQIFSAKRKGAHGSCKSIPYPKNPVHKFNRANHCHINCFCFYFYELLLFYALKFKHAVKRSFSGFPLRCQFVLLFEMFMCECVKERKKNSQLIMYDPQGTPCRVLPLCCMRWGMGEQKIVQNKTVVEELRLVV